jgi:Tol biopolymer transport system component
MDPVREAVRAYAQRTEVRAEAFERLRIRLNRRQRNRKVGTALLAGALSVLAVGVTVFAFVGRGRVHPAEIPPARIAVVRGLGGHPEVLTVAPDGSRVRHLAWGFNPSWSPDGTLIAFRAGTPSDFGHTVIEVVGPGGGRPRPVVRTGPSPGEAGRPAWSPDGRRIAFATYRGVMIVDVGGGGLRHVVQYQGPLACYDVMPSWSPDGGQIVFAVQCDGGALGLWVINPDGSGLRPILRAKGTGAPADLNPVWSRDGTRIAFDRGSGVYVVNADGTGLARIVRGSEPSWSPDGQSIAFGGRLDVFVLNLSTGRVRRVIRGASSPAWGPSGTTPTSVPATLSSPEPPTLHLSVVGAVAGG